jgi:hypothetical protein
MLLFGKEDQDDFASSVERVSPLKRAQSLVVAFSLVLGAGYFLQTTLAANISINSGVSVEFGQGIQVTAACSGSTPLTLTPMADFANTSGAGTYKFKSLKLSGIPIGCIGSDFTFSAFDSSTSTALPIFNSSSTKAVVHYSSGGFIRGVGGTGITVQSGSGEFTITFATPVALSGSVHRVTIETGSHTDFTCLSEGNCELLGAGPGGGTIFYYSATPFTCGVARNKLCNYLEVAPDGWNGGVDPLLHGCYGSGAGSGEGSFIFGEGAYNSVRLETGCTDRFSLGYDLNQTADRVVKRYSNAGYSDWFIPSKPELNELCKFARGQATGNTSVACTSAGSLASGFRAAPYFSSSTTENMKYRWDIWFNSATETYLHGYDNQQAVRPIRAF